MKKVILPVLFCFVLAMICGCGPERPKGVPPLYPLKVKVVYTGGQPVQGAEIMLTAKNPAEVGGNWAMTGITDASGVAEIATLGSYKGVPAGDFNIIVSKVISEGIPKPGPASDDAGAKALEEWEKSTNKEKRFALIDPKYDAASTSGFAVTVTKSGTEYTCEVGKEVRINIPIE